MGFLTSITKRASLFLAAVVLMSAQLAPAFLFLERASAAGTITFGSQFENRVLPATDTWATGQLDNYSEGDYVDFRFDLTADDAAAAGTMLIEYDLGYCNFFTNFFDVVSVTPNSAVVTESSQQLLGSGNNQYYEQSLDVAFSAATTVTVIVTLQLSNTAGECTGSSTGVRLAVPVQGSGDFANAGAKTLPLSANSVLENPSLTITKTVLSGDALPSDFTFNFEPAINGMDSVSIPDGQSSVTIDEVNPDGTFVITESGPDGYSFAGGDGTNCDVTDTVNGVMTATTAASTSNPSDAVCNFTNEVDKGSLTIVKNAIANNAQDFSFTTTGSGLSDFTLDDDSDGTLSNTKVFEQLLSGTYTVEETATAGWDLTDLDCDAEDFSVVDSKVTVNLQVGESATCTFENRQRGQIIVDKVAYPAVDQTKFPIALSPTTGASGDTTATIGNGETATFDVAQLETYSITEDLNQFPEWVETSNTCSDLRITGNTPLVQGVPTLYCTITNTKNASFTFKKDAVPNSLQDFTFDFAQGDTTPTPYSLDDDEGVDGADDSLLNEKTLSLTPDLPYSLVETNIPDGWKLTDIQCSEGVLTNTDEAIATFIPTPGQEVSCTFVNTKLASIFGTKYQVDAGGTNPEGLVDWTINLINTNTQDTISSVVTDGNGDYSFEDLLPGEYTIEEVLTSGWTQIVNNNGCGESYSLTLLAGVDSTGNDFCNFENVSISGYKWNDIDGDGNVDSEPKLADWVIFIDEDKDATLDNNEVSTTTDENGIYTFTDLGPGTYSVCEVVKSGWVQTYPGNETPECHDVVVSESGESVTPVKGRSFGNQGRGTITVYKTIDNSNGGTLDESNFTFKLNEAGQYTFESSNSENYDGVREFTNMPAGTYTVVEIEADMFGYETSYQDCSEQVLTPGGSITCYITNDDQPATIDVIKYADPCQTLQVFDFSVTQVVNEQEVEQSLQRDPKCYQNGVDLVLTSVNSIAEDDYVEVNAGEVTVSESVPEQWFLDGVFCIGDGVESSFARTENGATFTVKNGEHYECEFHNIQSGSLVITKFHDYNEDGEWDEGEPALSDWEMCNLRLSDGPIAEDTCIPDQWAIDNGWAQSTLTDENGEATFDNLYPNPYSYDEVLQEGWYQSVMYCELPYIFDRQEPVATANVRVVEEIEFPKNLAFVFPGQTTNCYIGNYLRPSVEIEKTNDTTAPVPPGTEVEFTIVVTVPGPDSSGLLKGATGEDGYLPVVVDDVLQDEFEYTGEFSAQSSVRGDLVASGITSDPGYSFPGQWVLTSELSNIVQHNEVITLKYSAIVGVDTPAGVYPSIATVTGYGDDITVVVSDIDDDQVEVFVPQVLATATEKLVETGQVVYMAVATGLLIVFAVLVTHKVVASDK